MAKHDEPDGEVLSSERKAHFVALSDEEQVKIILRGKDEYTKPEIDYVFKILSDRGWILLMDYLM